MSRALSPATSHAYGLDRVTQVWRLSRATVYRHRAAPDLAAPAGPTHRGPVGAMQHRYMGVEAMGEILSPAPTNETLQLPPRPA